MLFSGPESSLNLATEMGSDRNTMFSQNLYDALCQVEMSPSAQTTQEPEDDTMTQAIQRAFEAYQRLFNETSAG